MLTALITFSLAAALIVLLPGPDTLVVVRNLIRDGRRGATLTVLGVLSGLAIWVVTAALGLAALLRASRDGYTALRLVGAVYLEFRQGFAGMVDLQRQARPCHVRTGWSSRAHRS